MSSAVSWIFLIKVNSHWAVVDHDDLANTTVDADEGDTMDEIEATARKNQYLVGSRRFVN
jgi:hypothetical protein